MRPRLALENERTLQLKRGFEKIGVKVTKITEVTSELEIEDETENKKLATYVKGKGHQSELDLDFALTSHDLRTTHSKHKSTQVRFKPPLTSRLYSDEQLRDDVRAPLDDVRHNNKHDDVNSSCEETSFQDKAVQTESLWCEKTSAKFTHSCEKRIDRDSLQTCQYTASPLDLLTPLKNDRISQNVGLERKAEHSSRIPSSNWSRRELDVRQNYCRGANPPKSSAAVVSASQKNNTMKNSYSCCNQPAINAPANCLQRADVTFNDAHRLFARSRDLHELYDPRFDLYDIPELNDSSDTSSRSSLASSDNDDVRGLVTSSETRKSDPMREEIVTHIY